MITRWIAYCAALWAFVFGAFHVVWASGWYVGLDAEKAAEAFSVPWKYVYDLLVALMCFIAVPVAIAIVEPWGRRLPRKLTSVLVWSGTMLLVLRAVASVLQVLYLISMAQFHEELRVIMWEVWFYVGATLWVCTLWNYKRNVRTSVFLE